MIPPLGAETGLGESLIGKLDVAALGGRLLAEALEGSSLGFTLAGASASQGGTDRRDVLPLPVPPSFSVYWKHAAYVELESRGDKSGRLRPARAPGGLEK